MEAYEYYPTQNNEQQQLFVDKLISSIRKKKYVDILVITIQIKPQPNIQTLQRKFADNVGNCQEIISFVNITRRRNYL